jgi:hypothetical protein
LKEIDQSSGNTEKALQLITSLSQFKINANILKTTKAGKKMSKLGSSKNPEIKDAATDIVNAWKRQIQTLKKASPGITVPTEVSSQPPVESSSLPAQNLETIDPPIEEEKSVPQPRVREADLEYEQQKQEEEEDDDDYDEFISNNYTDDPIRQNIRKGKPFI